jgi:hypothetical protein
MKKIHGGKIEATKNGAIVILKTINNGKINTLNCDEYQAKKLAYIFMLFNYIGRIGQKNINNRVITDLDDEDKVCNNDINSSNFLDNYSILGSGSFKTGIEYVCEYVGKRYIMTIIESKNTVEDTQFEINVSLNIATSSCPFIAQLIGFIRFFESKLYYINNLGQLDNIKLENLHEELMLSKSNFNTMLNDTFLTSSFRQIWHSDRSRGGAVIIIERGEDTLINFFNNYVNKVILNKLSDNKPIYQWLWIESFLSYFYHYNLRLKVTNLIDGRIEKTRLYLVLFIFHSCLPFYYLSKKGNGYTHGDYKWDNVVIKSFPDAVIKSFPMLIDYGLCSDGTGGTYKMGAYAYRPRELRTLIGNTFTGIHDKKLDVYAFASNLKQYLLILLGANALDFNNIRLSNILVGSDANFLFDNRDGKLSRIISLFEKMDHESPMFRADPTTVVTECWTFMKTYRFEGINFIEEVINNLLKSAELSIDGKIHRNNDKNKKIFSLDHFPRQVLDDLLTNMMD